ncbi:hypothetical protein HanRHA438_Chr10g0448171 [Helianthus annuus]|uniref:Uncharacterized protein n=1 Tax=Helianthus annuus TaxID=4232 RepID=A0A251TJY3_HELAN|nr:hypothetical protein HanXRQr2_Chr10g0436031 [Helianthus annuus]KAJ0513512.1 hypothetical protein HanHA300_Chr10g0358451 [Helianthus annuus]KAJ0521380.1 hypothetical protein HanIR_Chr10g0470171 [Helianthus annuus]KAJ0529621.1 hypothetical protein HanHA89_Chr10g0379991 [Helianthus annuus]KAJ0696509.1 hypothetical protein HanLR1_Chr10g0357931 [Helianthus annuus]
MKEMRERVTVAGHFLRPTVLVLRRVAFDSSITFDYPQTNHFPPNFHGVAALGFRLLNPAATTTDGPQRRCTSMMVVVSTSMAVWN